MATTYEDVLDASEDEALLRKVQTAVLITANKIVTGGDTAAPFDQTAPQPDNRKKWVQNVLDNPNGAAKQMISGVLAAYQGTKTDLASLVALTEAEVQSEVDRLVDFIARDGTFA